MIQTKIWTIILYQEVTTFGVQAIQMQVSHLLWANDIQIWRSGYQSITSQMLEQSFLNQTPVEYKNNMVVRKIAFVYLLFIDRKDEVCMKWNGQQYTDG